jgi:hypothetical protein
MATVLVACAAAPTFAQLSVSRFTVDGGGGRSAGGSFALAGTIGQPDAGSLAGGTFALRGGFWAGGMPVATSVEGDLPGDGVDSPAAPAFVFRLYPPTPNPVAHRTAIAFDLPQAGPVRAAVYDVSGRLVRTLVDEPLAAGRHLRHWDRRNHSGEFVTSGVYFLWVRAGADQRRQKIVVVS